MKLLRIVCLIVFALSSISYLGYYGYKEKTRDDWGPTVTCDKDYFQASVTSQPEELLLGVTARDDKDGDVSSTLLIESISDFISPGKRRITYAAFDSNNNISKMEKELVYTDYSAPKFSLTNPLRFPVGDTEDILRYVRANDCIDGDLTELIKYDEPEQNFGRAVGNYPIKLHVTNSAGDTSYLPTEVEFYSGYEDREQVAEIKLKEYLIYLAKGERFDPKAYLLSVVMNEREYPLSMRPSSGGDSQMDISSIAISSEVNIQESGLYDVEYTLITTDGYSGATKLLVIVEE
ncbi:MAG: hypothetical protein K0R34_1728 [Herbinix sp.]|jgi:hypothetical protein|nr:hypothetical protein [Herbinix sp.]